MDTADDKDILKNIKEYLGYARLADSKGDNNTAITLFFKALVAACDWFVLQKTGSAPSSHEGRFRLLQIKFPELYRILDRDFPLYTESYRSVVAKEAVDLVKHDVEQLLKDIGIEKGFN